MAKGSTWYLVAAVENEPRTFRVSRISRAEVSEQACRRPREFDLPAYWERSASEFREKLPRYYATFLAEEPVMRWVRYRGWRLEEETAALSKCWSRGNCAERRWPPSARLWRATVSVAAK